MRDWWRERGLPMHTSRRPRPPLAARLQTRTSHSYLRPPWLTRRQTPTHYTSSHLRPLSPPTPSHALSPHSTHAHPRPPTPSTHAHPHPRPHSPDREQAEGGTQMLSQGFLSRDSGCVNKPAAAAFRAACLSPPQPASACFRLPQPASAWPPAARHLRVNKPR